jgi:multiple sugar transport system substrate-binding protein
MNSQDTPVERPIDGSLSRRTFLQGATAAGLVGAAAGASLPLRLVDAASAQTIVYWNLFGGGDGVRMVQMEHDFAKHYPNITVKATTLSWGTPYYTKLTTSTIAGKGPDVAILHMTRLPAYAPPGLLEPLDPTMLARYGITSDKFLPAIWQKAQSGGKLYAIPLDTHPFVMYYNTEICRKAGLLDSRGLLKPLVGTAAVLDAFKRAQKVTGKWGLALDTGDVTPWRLFYTLYSQMGGQVLADNGKKLVLDNAKAMRALSFMQELTLKSKVAPNNADYAGAVALFSSGKAGFHWNGDWEVTTFQTAKLPFDMTLFPNIFGGLQTEADSHSFVIPHQRTLDKGRLDAALTFISYLLKDSLVWARGGHIPAYLPVADSAAYKHLLPQAHYAAEAKHVVYDPPAWYSGSASDLELTAAGPRFQAVLQGHLAPAKALSEFTASVKKLISTPPPM